MDQRLTTMLVRLHPRLVATLLVALYVLAWTYLTRDLTFYWDDYFILESQFTNTFTELMASGVNGNWWPFTSLVTWLEVRIFGTWYHGYLVVNAILNAAITVLIWLIAREFTGPRTRWYQLAPIVVFPLTVQVVVNATVLTPSWPLSIMWALLSVLAILRRWNLALPPAFIVFSWLSMSGMFVINATIIAALVTAFWFYRRELSQRCVVIAFGLPIMGALGTFVGYQIMRLSPANGLVPQDVGSVLQANFNLARIVDSTFSLTSSWLFSPITPFAYVYESVLTRSAIFFSANIALLLPGTITVLVVALSLLYRRGGSRDLVPYALLVIPVVAAAGVLALTRGFNMFAPRYGLMWLIPVILMWILAAVLPSRRRPTMHRVTSGFGLLLLAFYLVMFPVSALQAIDVDRDRSGDSAEQRQLISQCLKGDDVTPLDSMAPGLNPERFCPLMRQLDSARWWH